jgi:hypothetical protein
MIRTEQQYEELNRIKPLHFSPLHLVVPQRSKFPPLSFAPKRLLRCRASVEKPYVQRCDLQVENYREAGPRHVRRC